MKKAEIYYGVLQAYENKFSWLGRAFAEEFLLSVASSNIQRFSKPDFRIRRHLMLYWSPAWVKSTLLTKAKNWLGTELCMPMADISNAALRGTVESGQFISPYCLKTPFAIASEFGQVISGHDSTELVQKLLCVLEEGEVSVSLGKIAFLTQQQRDEAEQRYGITFMDSNTFVYTTNWVLMAATYNKKFMVDNAFESRFNIMYPPKKLDSELTKFINNSPPYSMDEETMYAFRREVNDNRAISTHVKLPDKIFSFDRSVTPRECGSLQSFLLCRAWWGIETTEDMIEAKLKDMWAKSDEIWKTAEDKVLDCLTSEPKSVKQIAEEVGVTERTVYYALKKYSYIVSKMIDVDGNMGYKMG